MKLNGRLIASALVAVCMSVLLAVNLGWRPFSAAGPAKPALEVTCPDLASACMFSLDQQTYTLRSEATVIGSKPVVLTVTGPARDVHASWQMIGMEMGPNRYALQRQPNGSWQAQTLLPLCTQARRDWLLQLTVDGQVINVRTQSR
ncbi:hypothetical protein [Andreprevotia chitinilytica]|uniref:hypothetical protein n=1 Tax=Andreprevotia chitinilytica TaxID=396808 RepID=UPI0005534443|nr:hypothetical protein [Andreprevotia chitinilytica]